MASKNKKNSKSNDRTQNRSKNSNRVRNQKMGKPNSSQTAGEIKSNAHWRADSASNPNDYVNRVMGSTNDPSWYMKNPGIVEDASKISWFNQLGAKVGNFGTQSKPDYKVPGIMVFDSVTCPGYSVDATSGASLAGLSMYDAIRMRLNKPNPDYEAQDCQMYVLAADDIFCQYINILRAFGIAHTYSGDNLYTPFALCTGLYGWDQATFYEFIRNEANYRAEFNTLIYKASSFLFYPKDFSITDRHAWLYGNVFSDHNSVKAQLYAFRKHANWNFDEQGSDQGTRLVYEAMDFAQPSLCSMSAMLSNFDQCIERLRSSTLVRQLVADMRQAFGDTTTLHMGRCDEAFSLSPTYDTNALMQIENMDINFVWYDLESNDEFDSLNVTQDVDKNILVWAPFIPNDFDEEFAQLSSTDRVINIHTEDESTGIVAEATRLMVPTVPMTKIVGDIVTEGYSLAAASDFVIGAYWIDQPGDVYDAEAHPEVHFLRHVVRSSAAARTMHEWVSNDLSAWAAFDWAPRLFYIDSAEGVASKVLPIFEYDHYTVIGAGSDNNSVLARLNLACNLSMWSVPEWGAWVVSK